MPPGTEGPALRALAALGATRAGGRANQRGQHAKELQGNAGAASSWASSDPCQQQSHQAMFLFSAHS